METHSGSIKRGHRSQLEAMINTLRKEILSGEWAVGSFLPSELELGKRFTLSKNTVRKGLDVLVSEQLLEKIPRVGNRIKLPHSDSRTTIRFGYYPSLFLEADLETLIDRFQALHPHIRIELIRIPYPSDEPTVIEYIDKEMVDVATINYINYSQLSQTQSTLDKLEPFSGQDHEGIYPFLIDPFVSETQLKVMPFIFSPVILCYNLDHFHEAGLSEPNSSWSWTHLGEAANRLASHNGSIGFYFHLMSYNRWPLFLLQAGYTKSDNEDGVELRDAALLKGLQLGNEMVSNRETMSFISESDKDVEFLFRQGKVSMILTSYFSLNTLRDAKMNYNISPVPSITEQKTLLLVVGLAVHRSSPNKDAAMSFVRFLTSHESQLHIRTATTSIPTRISSAEQSGGHDINQPGRYQMYREIIPSFRLFTDMKLTAEDLIRMRRELKLYWSQLEDLDAVMNRLEMKGVQHT